MKTSRADTSIARGTEGDGAISRSTATWASEPTSSTRGQPARVVATRTANRKPVDGQNGGIVASGKRSDQPSAAVTAVSTTTMTLCRALAVICAPI